MRERVQTDRHSPGHGDGDHLWRQVPNAPANPVGLLCLDLLKHPDALFLFDLLGICKTTIFCYGVDIRDILD